MANYSTKGHYYIEESRFELKYLSPLLPKNATVLNAAVLDIGAGYGNNAKVFLERGYNVTAVEPNPRAVKTLKQLQKQYPLQLTVLESSIDSYRPEKKFDVIICCMVVHFMENHAAGIQAIRAIQSWTSPGGFNLVTGYMTDQPLPKDYSFLLKPRELSKLYENWETPWYQESYRLTLDRIYSFRDVARLILGRRGFKAARIIAQRPG